MIRVFSHYVPRSLLWLLLIEFVLLGMSLFIASQIRFLDDPQHPAKDYILDSMSYIMPVYALVMIFSLSAMGMYHRVLDVDFASIMTRLILAFSLGFLLFSLTMYLFPLFHLGRGIVVPAFIVSFFVIVFTRTMFQRVTSASSFQRKVVVLGTGNKAKQIEGLTEHCENRGVNIVGYISFNDKEEAVDEAKIIKLETDLLDYCVNNGINDVIVAIDDMRKKLPLQDLMSCKLEGINIIDMVGFFERVTGHLQLDAMQPSTMIFSNGFKLAAAQTVSKRVFDFVISLIILIIASPIMLVTYLSILISSLGSDPVLYRQRRVGLDGKIFDVLKFRSMKVDAEKNGAQYASKSDPRVTKIGAFIRKTRIDELPQLINVLKGDMSFVGPRPERPEFVDKYNNKIMHYALRHEVKPGITGWAQICYPYGDNEEDAKRKLEFDLYYVKNYCLFLDFNILMQTLQVVVFGKGAR